MWFIRRCFLGLELDATPALPAVAVVVIVVVAVLVVAVIFTLVAEPVVPRRFRPRADSRGLLRSTARIFESPFPAARSDNARQQATPQHQHNLSRL